jgi:predicted DNA-binding antitoxin AbrB/MazE fold protein
MALTLDATFENGVFVPAQRPELAEHERVRLTIEPASVGNAGVDVVRRRRKQRICIEPALARDIATNPEFSPEDI